MSTIDLDQILPQALNLYCFQNIWNEVGSELRNNIIPQPLYKRAVNGNVFIGNKTIPLPDPKKSYYVYAASRQTMYALVWPKQLTDQWITTEDLTNQYDILLHTYHTTGVMMHKNRVYVRMLQSGVGFIVAIEKEMSSTLLPYEAMDGIRLTLYYDSDLSNKISVKSFSVPYKDEGFAYRKLIFDYIGDLNTGVDNITVFINGYETKITGIGSFPLRAYIDIIHDTNVLLTFDVDLTEASQDHIFYSDLDKGYKQLIHIPKALNPDNKVLTHNTFDVYARRKHKVNYDIDGLYIHRCAEKNMNQITHNDTAIPMFVIDAYRDYLGTHDITLHVVVRQHDKNNVLIRDKSYIDLLYVHNDEQIIEHLLGRISKELYFWKASELEKTKYIEMMFDVPNIITANNMTDYIEGLGYYHTISLLCKRVVHTTITDWFTGTLGFPKPYIFQNDIIYPVVYLNGFKVNNDQVKYNNINSTTVGVGFTEDVAWKLGDVLSVEMFLDGCRSIYKIRVTNTNKVLNIPYNNFDLLEEIDHAPIVTSKFDMSTTKAYKPFTETIGNLTTVKKDDGTLDIVFGPTLVNRTFIVQNKNRVYTLNKDVTPDLVAGNPIYLPITGNIFNSTEQVPIYHTPHVAVYLNGKYLVEGIDFTVEEIRNYEGDFCSKVICIENQQYLTQTSTVEYIISSAELENETSGFVINKKAYQPDKLSLYFDTMTMFHVNGKLEYDVSDMGNYILTPATVKDGSIFQAHTCIPGIVKAYLNKYHPNDDLERLIVLNNYFYGKQPITDDVIVLDDQYKVYSIYMTTIIRDILNGTISGLSYDPDERRMKDQIKQYDYLSLADPIIQNKYDLHFVDTYPIYKQIEVPDVDMYNVIQMFIRICMPVDKIGQVDEVHPDESEARHHEALQKSIK